METEKENEHLLEACFRDSESEEELELGIEDAFRKFDRDGDGFLGTRDLKQLLYKIGVKLREHEFREFLAAADLDRDGKISFEGTPASFCKGWSGV